MTEDGMCQVDHAKRSSVYGQYYNAETDRRLFWNLQTARHGV